MELDKVGILRRLREGYGVRKGRIWRRLRRDMDEVKEGILRRLREGYGVR